MRSLLALVLLAPVVAAGEKVPVAPPPRLKVVPAVKEATKADVAPMPRPKAPVVTDPPEVTPAPKTTPVPVPPVPTPTPVVKAEPPAPTPMPKAEAVPPEPKVEAKGVEPVPVAAKSAPPAEPSFYEWTLPLYAVYAFAGLAGLVVLRTLIFPAKN